MRFSIKKTQLIDISNDFGFKGLYSQCYSYSQPFYFILLKYLPAYAIISVTGIVALRNVTSSSCREAQELNILKIPL